MVTFVKRNIHSILNIVFLLVIGILVFIMLNNNTKAVSAAVNSTGAEDKTYISGIVSDSGGSPLVASIEITDKADGSKKRYQTNLLGYYEIAVKQGEYKVDFSKGYEYERKSVDVSVKDRLRQTQQPVSLKRYINLAESGWYAGDLHQHSNYSDGYQDVSSVYTSDLANGLDWGALTDHNSVDGLKEWLQTASVYPSGNERFVPIVGMEVTTDLGHFNVFGTTSLVDYGTQNGAQDIERITRDAKDRNALIQVNHPTLTDKMGFNNWELIDRFNMMEIWNGKGIPNDSTNKQAQDKWFNMLNQGFYIPATCGSDNHDISGAYLWSRDDANNSSKMWHERGLYSGCPRTYAYCPDGLSQDSVLKSVSKGNSFLTNGPLIRFSLNGTIPGNTTTISSDRVNLEIDAADNRALEKCILIENGVPIAEFAMNGQQQTTISKDITVKRGNWYLIEAYGEEGGYAITNPVFVK